MKKVKKTLVLLMIIVLLFVSVVLIFYKPVGVIIMSRYTASFFRSQYLPSKGIHIQVDVDDWAWQFGGKTGLGQLEKLSNDPDLTEEGRTLAWDIYNRILSGEYLLYMRTIIEKKRGVNHHIAVPPWFSLNLIEYIYERDTLQEQ